MSDKLKVVLYWHMHQPEYRDFRSGQYHLPWTYLHIIKDYVDMAAHLETHPTAKSVVNFTPTLLEQIDDYTRQIEDYFDHGASLRDPMLESLVCAVLPSHPEQRQALIKDCLRANETRLINRFPEYRRLADISVWLEQHPDSLVYIDDQYFADLLVWFHLAWVGETVRRNNITVKRLLKKGSGFTLHERIELLRVIGDLTGHVISRYRQMAEQGQIELSMTPYAHPIMPLLIDINSAREAMPEAELPLTTEYPDGVARSHWHVTKGLQVFEDFFGFRPAGCWPAEGSVSEATIALLSEAGFRWVASGETVLQNSLARQPHAHDPQCIHHAWRYNDFSSACFFRDDGLSDLIGFTYADWHADDAVANLMHHLENIADSCETDEDAIVSIILDGENAWEYYPENGYYFLDTLYTNLAGSDRVELVTYSEYLDQQPHVSQLHHVVAGSWVYGSFSTWIGDKDKNHAWDLLADAKRAYDKQMQEHRFDPSQLDNIEKQLAICEGSDWFWWFGDYNAAESVRDFDYLYRLQLSNLYTLLGLEPPPALADVISHGSGAPAMGGTMRRGKETS